MNAQGPFSSTNPFSAGFLKAWVDQAGAFQEMFARLADQPAAVVPPSMAAPLLAPWKEFVDRMGMGGFDPAQIFPAAPALGLSREYQEIAGRLLELSKQFQQRYAEFMQQNAAVMQDAFQVLKKRLAETAPTSKTPADLYEAWIECAEGAYSQAAHSESFARLLAELCNISSAFKIERGKLTEQIARHLDLPSRAEIDTLHRQVHELKQAMRSAAPTAAAPTAAAPTAAAPRAAASNTSQAPPPAKRSKAPRPPRKRGKK